MSETDIQNEEGATPDAEDAVERPQAPPIESRFLFVDVSALRAKQLRRGAKLRLEADPEHPIRVNKAERLAMEEVRHGLVEWDLPEFKAVFDTR